jgi:hypothetical protein
MIKMITARHVIRMFLRQPLHRFGSQILRSLA